jgi:excisionase family DNA binding protein
MVKSRRMLIRSNNLLTVSEAASELGLQAGTVRSWVVRGHIHRMGTQRQKMGRPKIVIDLNELKRFIETNRSASKVIP